MSLNGHRESSRLPEGSGSPRLVSVHSSLPAFPQLFLTRAETINTPAVPECVPSTARKCLSQGHVVLPKWDAGKPDLYFFGAMGGSGLTDFHEHRRASPDGLIPHGLCLVHCGPRPEPTPLSSPSLSVPHHCTRGPSPAPPLPRWLPSRRCLHPNSLLCLLSTPLRLWGSRGQVPFPLSKNCSTK